MVREFVLLILVFSSAIVFSQDIRTKYEIEALPGETLNKRVYLIGDAGEDPAKQGGMKSMKAFLEQDPKASVIVLGDNIYPTGLHSKKSEYRDSDSIKIVGQMDVVKNHEGEVIFIPGNHDWDQGGDKGWKKIKRQQKFVEDYMGDDDNFMPDKGCPGPEVVELGDLSIIVIDTQWWLHQHEKAVGEADGCSVLNTAEFMVLFNEALKKNRNKHVLVVGHHPLKSNGFHGGHFRFKDHIFPLTNKNPKAYIPLPLIGSIYPIYRSVLGDKQDIQHPRYTQMVNALQQAMGEYENVVYAAGHEHNLQYFESKQNHLIVSGSGSKVTHLGRSKDLMFGAEQKGFARLSYYTSGRVWLEYFGLDEDKQLKTIFSKEIYQKDMVEIGRDESTEKIDYHGKTAIVVGDSAYEANGAKKFLMGSLNRPLWMHPLEVPYLDIHKEKGGLNPIKVGGGMQSKSVRLMGGDGNQYVVRQIKKNTTFLVSKSLRNTLAQELVYDGIAGSHPYASIVIGRLSDPLGIYHTNPKLVFLPKDDILGDLKDDFGDTFCLFEERPNKNMSHLASVGNSNKVIGYGDMVEKVHEKKNHRVDEDFVLKNRLFDMVIGDWDRHDDQWRWASFKKDGITKYRPIPRDRDQAFFKFNGLLPKITNRKWMIRKFQNYGAEIRDIKGQNFNARYFDRSWMSSLDKQDWLDQAKFISDNLTDTDIEEAIGEFPKMAQDYNGEFLIESLKARRDNIDEIALSYYKVLAKSVKVVGKLGKDYFEVIRKDGGSVEVNVYPLKDGSPVKSERYFHRVFLKDETREILLYGLDGKDTYHLVGDVDKSIIVRIIGGDAKDKLIDESNVRGLRKLTRYYDDKHDNKVEASKETKVNLLQEKKLIQYERKDFIYNTYLPLPAIGSNSVDGFFIGAGVNWMRHGFNKKPYKSKQSVSANIALKTEAFNFKYTGHFLKLIKPFDLGLSFEVNSPFIFDFNDFGNETIELDNTLNTVRLERTEFKPFISLSNKTGSGMLKANFHLNSYEIERGSIDSLESTFIEVEDLFAGGGLSYEYVNVDNRIAPHRGIVFGAVYDRSYKLDGETDIDFSRYETSLSLYLPLGWMPMRSTLALRSAINHVDGDFSFYQSAFLGGQKEFRGITRNRFSGNTAQYNNIELRMDLKEIRNYALPFKVGLMGHYDIGKVWLESEDSDLWHSSVGGGLYFDILGFLTLNGTYSVSDSGNEFLLQGGFFF